MDNSQKAIQMAFAVFLFVIAATTAIFLYTTLIENTDNILLISDRNRSSTENILNAPEDSSREIKKEEVIMTILDIENNKSYFEKIEIRDNSWNLLYEFATNDEDNISKLKMYVNSSIIIGDIIYDEENKILIYKRK